MNMKPIIKLNEDFFDDLDDNTLIDEPDHDFFDEPTDDTDYTYNLHFIIYTYQFIEEYKGHVSKNTGEYKEVPVYSFEEHQEYKPTIESGFLSMKKVLEYILQALPIVTNYSKPKFCSSYEKIIEEFPFIENDQSNELGLIVGGENFITLRTSINLHRRKNERNLLKMFYSFWKLQKIYDKLLTTIYPNITNRPASHINMGVYKNNSNKESCRFDLNPPSSGRPHPFLLKLINLLNSKDEIE